MGVGDDGEGSGGASGKGAKGTDLEVALGTLDAYCRALLTALPSGVRGVGGARAIITAIPAAARLGWSNLTLSAPAIFRTLHGAGLLSDIPGNSDVPAALRLVAAVSGLVTRRSQRRWTVWFACACDPERPLGASIRDSVTRAMLDRESTLRSSAPTVSRLAERDRLAEEARASAESQASLLAERDRLAEELRVTSESLTYLRGEHAQAVEGLRSGNEELASIKVERDQTAEKLLACQDSLARSRDDATRAKSESARLAHERDALKSAASSSKEEVAALRRDLKSESDAHKQELATVRQEQLDARKKAARLAKSHAGECTELRERIRALMIKAEQLEGRNARINEERARESKRRELVEEIVGDVQALLGLPPFDPKRPDRFIDSLILWNNGRKGAVEHLLAKCARELNLAIARGAKAHIVLGMTHQGHSTEDVEEFLRRRPELLESKIHQQLEAIRSRLSEQGVKLPPARVKLDDLDVE